MYSSKEFEKAPQPLRCFRTKNIHWIVYLQYQRVNRKKASIFSILATRKNLFSEGCTASFWALQWHGYAGRTWRTRPCSNQVTFYHTNSTLVLYKFYKPNWPTFYTNLTYNLTYVLYKFETAQICFIKIWHMFDINLIPIKSILTFDSTISLYCRSFHG